MKEKKSGEDGGQGRKRKGIGTEGEGRGGPQFTFLATPVNGGTVCVTTSYAGGHFCRRARK